MTKNIAKALRAAPRPTILALATSLHAVARAQVAAGKRMTPREQEILDAAAKILPNQLPRKSP